MYRLRPKFQKTGERERLLERVRVRERERELGREKADFRLR